MPAMKCSAVEQIVALRSLIRPVSRPQFFKVAVQEHRSVGLMKASLFGKTYPSVRACSGEIRSGLVGCWTANVEGLRTFFEIHRKLLMLRTD